MFKMKRFWRKPKPSFPNGQVKDVGGVLSEGAFLKAFKAEMQGVLHQPAVFRIPFHVRSQEERAWTEAVDWLKAHEAAAQEWPFPRRDKYIITDDEADIRAAERKAYGNSY